MQLRGYKRIRAVGITAICVLPALLPVGLAAFSAVAMLLLVTNLFYLPLLLGFGLPAAAVAVWAGRSLTHDNVRAGPFHGQLRMDGLVLMGLLLWMGLNIPFSTQHILTNRDPATYAVAGAWLASHHSLQIPKPALISALPGITAESYGFNTSTINPAQIYAQGAHLLPALLGVVGKLFGLVALLHANVVFGAAALLSFYGFARLVMRSRWAAVATAVLAVCLPMVYFSRDTYTEPLTLLFIFSALSLMVYAMQHGRLVLWALAGMSAGTATLLRIDAYTFLIALEAYLLIYLAFAPNEQRLSRVKQAVVMVIPAALLGVLGWIDVSQLSSGYYRDLHTEIVAQFIALAGLAAIGLIGVGVAWHTKLTAWLQQLTTYWFVRNGLWAAIALFFVFLLVRASWFFILAVAGRADAIPVKIYSESTTVLWLVWYIGPVITLAGMAGLAYGWPQLLRGRIGQLLPFFLVLAAACALYLLNPQISADQIWASRRFLPIIFPGFTIVGCLVLQYVSRQMGKSFGRLRLTPATVTMMATLAVAGPALASLPFWDVRPLAELSGVTSLCQALPPNTVVVWIGSAGGFAIQPTQAFCGVESVAAVQGADLRALLGPLQAAAATEHKIVYLAASNMEAKLLPDASQAHVLGATTYVGLEHTYKRFPLKTVSYTEDFAIEPLVNRTD